MGELLLYWNSDFEQLRQFVNKNAELKNGVWSSPERDKKTYSDGHTLISWRKGKELLQIEGKEVNLIKAKLCSAICNVNFVTSGEGTRVIVSGQKTHPLRCLPQRTVVTLVQQSWENRLGLALVLMLETLRAASAKWESFPWRLASDLIIVEKKYIW